MIVTQMIWILIKKKTFIKFKNIIKQSLKLEKNDILVIFSLILGKIDYIYIVNLSDIKFLPILKYSSII